MGEILNRVLTFAQADVVALAKIRGANEKFRPARKSSRKKFRRPFATAVLLCLVFIALIFVMGGCKSTSRRGEVLATSANSPVPLKPDVENSEGGGSEVSATLFPLDALVAEARDFQIPAGADAAVFELLRAELLRLLEERSTETGGVRYVSFVKNWPLLTDLSYDEPNGIVTWKYGNRGDYDLSGEVGIGDITPIALNFGKSVAGDPFLEWLDGDRNGEIGLPDITPIANNYLNRIDEFRFVTLTYDEDGFLPVGAAIPRGKVEIPLKEYSAKLPNVAWLRYFSVAAFADGEQVSEEARVFDSPLPAENLNPWPMSGQNSKRNFRSPYSVSETPVSKWKFTFSDEIYVPPVVRDDGTLVASSPTRGVDFISRTHGINPDGSVLWAREDFSQYLVSPAFSADGRLYTSPLEDFGLCAYDREGSLVWGTTEVSVWDTALAVGQSGMIYTAGNYFASAFNSDGSKFWKYIGDRGFDDGDPAIAVMDDGVSYLYDGYRHLVAIGTTGKERWKFEVGRCLETMPAISDDGTIYVAAFNGIFYAINGDGTLKWKHEAGQFFKSTIAISADGTAYVTHAGRNLLAFSSEGELLWSYQTRGVGISPASIDANGTILIKDSTQGGQLIGLNPDGSVKWKVGPAGQAFDKAPVIGMDGSIYTPAGENAWFAVGPSSELPSVEWVAPLSVKSGELITFEASAKDATTYMWNFGDAAWVPYEINERLESAVIREPGVYSCSLKVYGSGGSSIFDFELTVTESGDAPAIWSVGGGIGFFVLGHLHELKPIVTGALPMSYFWNFGEGFSPSASTSEVVEITPLELGKHECSLTVVNAFGTSVSKFTIEVAPPPKILGVAPLSGLAGEIVEFSADIEGKGTYKWFFKFGEMYTEYRFPKPKVKLPSTPGVYDAYVTLSNYPLKDRFDFQVTVLQSD